jgi:hypothetical protein
MYLDAVSQQSVYNEKYGANPPAFDKWRDFPVSRISHHGRRCCELAREWIFAMDYSQLNGAGILTGPRWLRQRFTWGPTSWQIHWCEAVRKKHLDCGVFASIATEIFRLRGARSFPVQLVQRFSPEATSQWQQRWDDEEVSTHWIGENLIYHEGSAVVVENSEIKIWDPSASWWIGPNQFNGYGSSVALRVNAGPDAVYTWGPHRVHSNEWMEIV